MGENYLIHHGILGQKWGRMQGPPYPLDSGEHSSSEKTAAKSAGVKVGSDSGKYSTDVEGKTSTYKIAKKEYKKANRAYNNSAFHSNKELRQLQSAKKNYNIAKKELEDDKIKEKLNSRTSVSKHQQKYIDEYKQKGFTDEEAEIQAYKRARTEKAIAITAGLTLAAATAYVGYKHYNSYVDKVLDSKTILNNVSTDKDVLGVRDAVYTSFGKGDTTKYRGMLGKQLQGPNGTNTLYNTSFGINNKIKIASDKSGLNALKELTKDTDYKSKLESSIRNNNSIYNIGGAGTPKQRNTLSKAVKSLDKGKIDKNVYDAMNLGLVDHSNTGQELSSKFYNNLKSKGYSGVKDVNDRKLSGYDSKTASIIFDKSGIMTKDVRQLSTSEVNSNFNKSITNTLLKRYGKQAIAYTAAGAGIKAASNIVKTSNQNKAVEKYRKEHPNSDLSYNEILKATNRI